MQFCSNCSIVQGVCKGGQKEEKEKLVDSYSSCVCLSMNGGAGRLQPLYIALSRDTRPKGRRGCYPKNANRKHE